MTAVHLGGLENCAFFKVEFSTPIGVSGKKAVLIVEFARKCQREELAPYEVDVETSRLRLRPIVMTSPAVTRCVVPLVIASGESW